MQIFTLLAFLPLLYPVTANVEKVVFIASDIWNDPVLYPDIFHLSPSNPILRRDILATFPSGSSSWRPSDSWFLIDKITEGQRYEVRVCWAATQPTSFSLTLHSPKDVTESAVLNNSLWGFLDDHFSAGYQLPYVPSKEEYQGNNFTLHPFQGLLLRVSATADYYSTNKSLMRNGLLVDFDTILDPYALNVIPESLIPTALYILVLVAVSWVVANGIWLWLDRVAQSDISYNKTEVVKKTN